MKKTEEEKKQLCAGIQFSLISVYYYRHRFLRDQREKEK